MAGDITKNREQERSLRITPAKLQAVVDNTVLGITLVRGTRIVWVNATVEKMFGDLSSELTTNHSKRNVVDDQ